MVSGFCDLLGGGNRSGTDGSQSVFGALGPVPSYVRGHISVGVFCAVGRIL
jgi:hypothetical protein